MPFKRTSRFMLTLVSFFGLFSITQAQDVFEPADIVNDEGGVAVVSGSFTISGQYIVDQLNQPVLLLIDDTYSVDRAGISPEPPLTSQVMGVIDTEIIVDEPVTYELALPIEPQGNFHDVDQDDDEDSGVQVFVLTLYDNSSGTVFADDLDSIMGYTSTRYSIDPETLYEVTGGQYIVYAADDEQGFPAGFGDDHLLFTEDDPIVGLPAGYTLVDMDSDPFTFDRSRKPTVDLIESEDIAEDDFSSLSYIEAFDALVEKAKREYPFTEMKGLDWDALSAELRPRVEAAEDDQDAEAFLFVINDFALSIPDTHIGVGSDISTAIEDAENELIAGGLGLALRELTDGRVLVNYVLEDGPAAQAGIEVGARIKSINGQPVEQAIESVKSVNGPYSLPEIERLDQVRFVTRFPLDTEVEIAYQNPGDTEVETSIITAIDEFDSLQFSRQFVYGDGSEAYAAPVEFHFMNNGYAYVRVNTFDSNFPLLIASWEYFLRQVRLLNAPGIIIDMRTNGGGFTGFGDRLASYFFNEVIELYYSESYNEAEGDFFYDENIVSQLVPTDDRLRYDGAVAVLIGPGCVSACEYFVYDFTKQDRAAIIGEYPTSGAGGGWITTYLPEGISFSLPTDRARDTDGNIIIEGQGVKPTLVVPVTEENMSASGDAVLDTAIAYLDETTAINLSDAGTIQIGDTVTGTVVDRERVQYTLSVESDVTLDILLTDEAGELDTYLWLYDGDGNLLMENDDAEFGATPPNSAVTGFDVAAGDTLVIEVATFDDKSAGDYILQVVEV